MAALQRALSRRLPERSVQWAALLNALAAQVEPPGSDPHVVEHVVGALRALLERCGVDPGQGQVHAKLEALAQAQPAWPAPPAPTDQEPEAMPAYSLGANAVAEVAYLRLELGLSVAYVNRHLTQHLGMRMPAEALLRCVTEAAPPSALRRPTRR